MKATTATTTITTIGIDYSITSPGICVHNGDSWGGASNCDFYFFNSKKTEPEFNPSENNIHWIEYGSKEFSDDFERFNYLSDSICSIIDTVIIKTKRIPNVFIEGYSFGSTGSRLFQIAENTALLKYKILKRNIPLNTVPPTTIKKFATGKGNSNKENLEDYFIDETGISFREILSQTPSQFNPSSDLIDAYYICKYGFFLLSNGDSVTAETTTIT